MTATPHESTLLNWVAENPEYRTLHFLESDGLHSAVISDLTWWEETPQIWPVKATIYLSTREAAAQELVTELRLDVSQERAA